MNGRLNLLLSFLNCRIYETYKTLERWCKEFSCLQFVMNYERRDDKGLAPNAEHPFFRKIFSVSLEYATCLVEFDRNV